MELESVFGLMDDFYDCSGLLYCLCDAKGKLLHGATGQLDAILPQYYEYALMDFRLQKRDMDHPLAMLFDYGVFVGIAQLQENLFLIAGPVGPFEKKRSELVQLFQRFTHPEKLVRLCDFFMSVPTFSLRRFYAAFSLLIYLGSGRRLSVSDLMLQNAPSLSTPDSAMPRELFQTRETLAYHADRSFEEGVCAAVEAGNPEDLDSHMHSPVQGDVGMMSTNPMNQVRYTFISFATLLTRAAIRGGLPQESAFSLSDVYCQQMDAAFDVQAINVLSYQMAMAFCKRVQECKAGKRYTSDVQKCVDYIDKHLHESIRVSDMARLCGLCTRSISLKFREETGLSIPDYISREKLREAKYLLANSDYSLAEISSCLQYNSQSYFTQKFKEACGMTPQKYRDTHARGQ